MLKISFNKFPIEYLYSIQITKLRSVYSSVPELEKPKKIENDNSNKPVKNGILQAFEKTKNGWSDYFSQGVVLIPSDYNYLINFLIRN